ncbi:MAG TPA: hypothetical protein VIM61_09295 [Chthoniobacterales bacterium]
MTSKINYYGKDYEITYPDTAEINPATNRREGVFVVNPGGHSVKLPIPEESTTVEIAEAVLSAVGLGRSRL